MQSFLVWVLGFPMQCFREGMLQIPIPCFSAILKFLYTLTSVFCTVFSSFLNSSLIFENRDPEC